MRLNVKKLGIALGKPSREIFRDVSFTLEGGSSTLVTGPSGSGKTALGMAAAGLLPQWAGDYEIDGAIEIDGFSLKQGNPLSGTALVLENPYTQLSGLKATVADELAFPLECTGAPRKQIASAVDTYAAMFNIGRLLDRGVRTLSGGELQRLLIAASLIACPRLLILDRPLTEIDEDSRTGILRIIIDHIRAVRGSALLAEDPWLLGGASFDAVVSLDPNGSSPRSDSPNAEEASEDIPNTRFKPSEELLRVENIKFAYPGGNEVLEGITFSMRRGGVSFLTGPNGAGKTTLAKLLAGLLAPLSGDIILDGVSYRTMTPERIASRVGLTFQNASLHLSRTTVREEFALAEQWGRPAWHWAEVFGLGPLFDRHPLELTQAEMKRLATALAAGGHPAITVLDEPSQYQDTAGFRSLVEGIGQLTAEGTAVLIITHDPRLHASFPSADIITIGRITTREHPLSRN